LIRFDERDIYINPSFKEELKERNNSIIKVPQLFLNGKNFGVSLDL
jgi:glutaredoxin